jgi:hypothetical protein
MSSFSLWDALPSAVSSSWFLYTATTPTTTPSPLDFFGFNLNGRQVAMTLAGAWIMLGSQTSTFSWCDVWRFTQYNVWVQCRVPQTVSSLIFTQSLLWPSVVLYFAVALGLARSIVFFMLISKTAAALLVAWGVYTIWTRVVASIGDDSSPGRSSSSSSSSNNRRGGGTLWNTRALDGGSSNIRGIADLPCDPQRG